MCLISDFSARSQQFVIHSDISHCDGNRIPFNVSKDAILHRKLTLALCSDSWWFVRFDCSPISKVLGLYYARQLIAENVVGHWFNWDLLHFLQSAAWSAIDCKTVASHATDHPTISSTRWMWGIDSNVACYTMQQIACNLPARAFCGWWRNFMTCPKQRRYTIFYKTANIS